MQRSYRHLTKRALPLTAVQFLLNPVPQPAVPAQPAGTAPAGAPPHQRGTIPGPPPAAPVTGNHK